MGLEWAESKRSTSEISVTRGRLTLIGSTVFGLYRDGTELRGVYTGKKKVARAACQSVALTVGCDYPILLGTMLAYCQSLVTLMSFSGNDPRYGGMYINGYCLSLLTTWSAQVSADRSRQSFR